MSYGSSSLMSMMAALGVLLSITRFEPQGRTGAGAVPRKRAE